MVWKSAFEFPTDCEGPQAAMGGRGRVCRALWRPPSPPCGSRVRCTDRGPRCAPPRGWQIASEWGGVSPFRTRLDLQCTKGVWQSSLPLPVLNRGSLVVSPPPVRHARPPPPPMTPQVDIPGPNSRRWGGLPHRHASEGVAPSARRRLMRSPLTYFVTGLLDANGT